MSSPRVIIFGPTGNVARVAATTAQKHGAQVFLAMRDTKKTISGLSADDEKTGGYERVHADLTKPDTVREAVTSTGAKHAFIYLAHGTHDHMKATLEALKAGGVEFVVFLSSFTVREPLEEIAAPDIIPYMHAQVELQLSALFGKEQFVALRPGAFATNIETWSADGIRAGHVKMWSPGAEFDEITPEDMGEVAGSILAKGAQEQHAVYLFGPQMLSMEDQVRMVGRALGKEITIEEIGREEAVRQYVEKGTPEVLAEYLTSKLGETRGGFAVRDGALWREGVSNVEKYTGHAATAFEEWVKANLDRFA